MHTLPDDGRPVNVPVPIPHWCDDPGALGMAYEMATQPDRALARQVRALAGAPSEQHPFGVLRFRLAALALADRILEDEEGAA